MAHHVEHLLDASCFHRVAGVHDRDLVAGLEDQPEIVGDVDHRGAELADDFLDELDDPGLHRYVEGRRRLIEQQSFGIGQERHGDQYALLLSAGKLMRIGEHDPLRIGQPHLCQQRHRAFARLLLVHVLMDHQHFAELITRPHRGIEGRHRLLVDHGDLRAADRAQLLLRQA